jgi:hypothetical protein
MYSSSTGSPPEPKVKRSEVRVERIKVLKHVLIGLDNKVSVWRTILVANEWVELQVHYFLPQHTPTTHLA